MLLEPLAGRWLYHATRETPSTAFEDGERLVRALRCAACHEIAGEARALPAPALNAMAGNLGRPWLINWLAQRPPERGAALDPEVASRRMPHFPFEQSEANAIADYLFANSETLTPAKEVNPGEPAVKEKKKDKKSKAAPIGVPPVPNREAGATLFRSLGCLACHRVGELGTDNLFGGGNLDRVAQKRPAGYFAGWLADPARLNRNHRMPVFTLNPFELESLALYLQSLGDKPAAVDNGPTSRAEEGRQLVEQARCAACHDLPKRGEAAQRRPLRKLDLAALRGRSSCLLEPDAAARRPGYRLSQPLREAVTVFLSENRSGAAQELSGKALLAQHSCLSCHARGRARGLAFALTPLAEVEPTLCDLLPALTPPALFGVGDKLHEQALLASIQRSQPPLRGWLRVRMPKFPLSDAQAHELARHLIAADRIPERSHASHDAEPKLDATVEAAGARLVTAEGFGCMSCHAIGKWQPTGVALNASGAQLSEIGERVRRPWFDRWVRNPARIVPQMEMPAVVQPARGVLGGKLDAQLASVWQVLNRPGFTPPAPNALRVVRRANRPEVTERSAVLTEVIELDGRSFVKPLVIGLPNRHNVLFDLAHGRLAAWWIGDTGRQTTRGKSWHWEAGGAQLLSSAPRDSAPPCEWSLVQNGQSRQPIAKGQYLTEFDWFAQAGQGLEFAHRLHLARDGQEHPLHVVQRFAPLGATPGGAGFSRRVEISELPDETVAEFVVLGGDVTLAADRLSATLAGRGGRVQIALRSPGEPKLTKTAGGAVLNLGGDAAGTAVCELEYRADVAVDQFAPRPEADRSLERAMLDVVPGFEAVRLPVTNQAMPTGLAWRGDGTLVVSSLEGRVWLGHDDDGDGLEDRLVPFSDDLAAPFGVATTGESIDVINKYGLLRLSDDDRDGHADRTELLASGWGHTTDYHDWAIGLPRDAAGNYYVSLACQQDARSEVAATWRGSVVKLAPREPSRDDPRRFAAEPLCGGLRFAQGIALLRSNDLFVTDNQGNYTPFNELNHVVRGARYGFLNRLESDRGLSPPHRPAAIEIPHPWTRSVNGICFLEAPPAVRERLGHELYGPLAGQLVGCEYDTRRLVRMSLERVGGDFQGAVYPLSSEPAAGGETFEGPLVCQVAAQRRPVYRQHSRQRLGRRLEHRFLGAAPLARRVAAWHCRSQGGCRRFLDGFCSARRSRLCGRAWQLHGYLLSPHTDAGLWRGGSRSSRRTHRGG